MSRRTARANGRKSAVRAAIEHVFARQKGPMGLYIRTIGLISPLWLMTRKALNDDKLGDFFVPAGTEIYISPYLI